MNAIFRGKTYGAVTVGERGQVVIPSSLRKELNIKAGEQLMIFAHPEKKVIHLMHTRDFNHFLRQAAKAISRLESKVPKKK